MSTTDYRQRHPLAWTLIAGAAIAGIATAGLLQGWLPGPARDAAQACAECAVVEAVGSDAFQHEVVVRYEDGSTGTFSLAGPPAWQPGDRVRVVDGTRLVAG